KSLARKLFYATLIILVVLAVIFAYIDLQISILLVERDSLWSRFIANYGEVPGTLFIIISLFIYFRIRVGSNIRKNLIFSFLTFGILLWQIYSLFMQITKKDFSIQNINVILISFFGIIIIILIFFLNTVDISYFQKYDNPSRVTLGLAILNPLLFVQSIKILWGRIRFRDLASDYADYTPWFIPQGITGHQSFPSGHTAMGWMLLPLLLLTLNKGWKAKVFLVTIIFAWGFGVALGRVVIGAHYASDTLFSTGVAFLGYLLLYRYIYYSQKPSLENGVISS
ncbi:MAG: phosphatase PAP2 family protein, partial [Candidatus Hodarchaeota archaeon]